MKNAPKREQQHTRGGRGGYTWALKMATDKIRADSAISRPCPRAKSHARIRARHPPRVATCVCARYPRAKLARGHARILSKYLYWEAQDLLGGIKNK